MVKFKNKNNSVNWRERERGKYNSSNDLMYKI